MNASLVRKGWLLREWSVSIQGRIVQVVYSGRGKGYESVYVDGMIAVRSSSMIWFVPRLEFRIGELLASVEVRVWPWTAFKFVQLSVEGSTLYIEGSI